MGRKGYVEARVKTIRVAFYVAGKIQRESVQEPPTAKNIAKWTRTLEQIQSQIAAGEFDRAAFFPDSVEATNANANTIGALLDSWLTTKSNLSENTKSQYKNAANFWKTTIGEDASIKSLTYKKLAETIGGHPWSSAEQQRNYLIALRGSLSLHYCGALAASNPMLGIASLKRQRKTPKPLSLADRDRVLGYMRTHYDERVYAYFQWQFATGMRPEEAIELKWNDLHEVAPGHVVAHVARVKAFRGIVSDETKTKEARDVDLRPGAMAALDIMRPRTGARADGYIFERPGWAPAPGSGGGKPSEAGPWSSERVQRERYWLPALKALCITRRPAYATRHTCATEMLGTGAVPPAYIAAQLGHDVKILLTRYARWMPENDQRRAHAALISAMERV